MIVPNVGILLAAAPGDARLEEPTDDSPFAPDGPLGLCLPFFGLSCAMVSAQITLWDNIR